jgi:hypothetical protein
MRSLLYLVGAKKNKSFFFCCRCIMEGKVSEKLASHAGGFGRSFFR